MKKKNDIEDLFKESFENFEADVNPSSWKNIQAGLKGVGLGVLAKAIFNKIGTNALVAIVSSAATVISTVWVMNWNSNTKATPQTAGNNTITAPKTIAKPAEVNEIKNFLATNDNSAKNNEQKIESKPANLAVVTNKKDKKKIESLINSLSTDHVASISASCVGGAVPLVVNLSNSGIGKINKWVYNDGTKSTTSANPIKVFDVPGIYTVTLVSTSADGKTSRDSIKIEATGNSSVESIPMEFSPNDDGVNDVFIFKPVNIVNYSITIFDKKTNVVYYYKGTDGVKWDGKTPKGEKAKEGIYYYTMSGTGVDGKKYDKTGKIKLVR